MPDANTIALVSVVAGATTAITVPLITAGFQSKAERRRFGYERAGKDVEELRALLDETALALHDTDRAMRRFTGVVISKGPQDLEAAQPAWNGLLGEREKLTRLVARVSVRRPRGDPVNRSCAAALEQLDALLASLWRCLLDRELRGLG